MSYLRNLLTLTFIGTFTWASSDMSWAHTCTWAGGTGGWEGPGWGCTGEDHPPQPFSDDDVFINSGRPVVNFVEDIATLLVAEGAGIDNDGALTVHGSVTNEGQIVGLTDSQFQIGVGSLSGGGELVLTDSIGTNSTITFAYAPNPCCVLHGTDHTIRGEGTINGNAINDGFIRAEETSGDSTATLTINGTMTNNGVIRSSATGTILLESATLTMGATGQFISDGQSIVLSTATINGGSIDAINGAKFVRRPDVGGSTFFSGVTINGDFDVLVNNAGVAGIGTGITNNGTMTIDNLGVANGQFHMDAGSTLDGTGTVILNRSNSNTRISGNFTHGTTHTIRGAGRIQATIVNNGSILAEPKNDGALLRVLNSPITNNSLLQAESTATLRIEQQSVVTQGAAGRIRAANGGRVEIRDGSSVIGGKLQTEGTGIIADTSSSVLTNVTNEGEFHVQAGSTTRVNTTLTNNGTITVNPTGVAGITGIEFSTHTLLQGTGTIVLNQTGNSAFISSAQSNQDITQAAGHTIRGGGRIASGFFGTGKFINNGQLEGNSAAQPLVIQAKLSGSGALKNVQIGGDGFGISHTLAEVGTTAIVPVEGSYNFVGFNSMLVDLAGTTPGTGHDQLSSTGPITISSTATRLEVSRVDGFFPVVGNSFTLLTTTDALTGNFGTVVLPVLPFGLSWQQSQTSTALSITLTGDLGADFDNDGDVDGDDLAIWQAGYGTGTLQTQGNADGDNDVDGRDFMIWQRSYGWGVVPPVDVMAVPEPATLVMVLAMIVFNPLRRCPRAG